LNVRKIEVFISSILRYGVELSGFLIMIGISLFLWTGDDSCVFGILSWDWILWGSPFLEPSHILFIGFLILIATPLIRVVASVVAYSINHDWIYTIITGSVLLILMIGIILGVG
jgi:uncharacterized membrane protein